MRPKRQDDFWLKGKKKKKERELLAHTSQKDSLAWIPGQIPVWVTMLSFLQDDYWLCFLLEAVVQESSELSNWYCSFKQKWLWFSQRWNNPSETKDPHALLELEELL